MLNLNQKDYFDLVKKDGFPIVFFFSAEWCAPCKVIQPNLENFAKNMIGQFDIYKIDAEKELELVELFSVMALPSLIILLDGKEVERFCGNVSFKKIRESILKYV